MLATTHMRHLVERYAGAKSRADVDGALAYCHESFTLEAVSLGVRSRNRAETAAHLRVFFAAFPDYAVTLEDLTFGRAAAGCWGSARMTMHGAFAGIAPTGASATLPVFCAFTFADGLLASERFFFDLATLCIGIQVEIGTLQAALHALRDVTADPPKMDAFI